ncbi:uncharacterized protein LOC144145293 [Haemaphysalis longicornis]
MSEPGKQAATPSSQQGSPPQQTVLPAPLQPTVPPVQPTVPPLQPALPPAQTTVQPTQPAVSPVQPTVSPVQPTVSPVQPTVSPVQPTVSPVQPTVSPVQPTVSPVQPTVSPVQPTVSPLEPALPPAQPAVSPAQPAVLQRKPKRKPTELSLDDSGTPLLEQSDSEKSCSISPSDDREMAISPPVPRDDLPAYTALPSVETNEPSGVDLLADPQPSTSTGFRGVGFVPHFLISGQQSSSSDSLSEKAPPMPDTARRFSLPLAAAEAPPLPDSSLGSSGYTSLSSIDEASMEKRNVDSWGGSSRASVQHSSESDIPMSSPSLERKAGSEMTGTSTPSEMSPAHAKWAATAVVRIPKRLRKQPLSADQGEGAEEPEVAGIGTTSPVPTELPEDLDVHMSSPVPPSVEHADDEDKAAQEAQLGAMSSDPAVGAPGNTQEAAEQPTLEAVKAEGTRPFYELEREERGAREAEALKKLNERAAAERAQLLAEHASQTAARKSKNGAAEAKFVAERDQPVPKGEEWKRVSEMCDLRQNAPHHDRDVSRYRAVLSDLSQGGAPVPRKPDDSSADPKSAPMAVDAPSGTRSTSTSPTPPPES